MIGPPTDGQYIDVKEESNENLVESVLSNEVVGEITQIPAKVAITHQLSLPMKNTAL